MGETRREPPKEIRRETRRETRREPQKNMRDMYRSPVVRQRESKKILKPDIPISKKVSREKIPKEVENEKERIKGVCQKKEYKLHNSGVRGKTYQLKSGKFRTSHLVYCDIPQLREKGDEKPYFCEISDPKLSLSCNCIGIKPCKFTLFNQKCSCGNNCWFVHLKGSKFEKKELWQHFKNN